MYRALRSLCTMMVFLLVITERLCLDIIASVSFPGIIRVCYDELFVLAVLCFGWPVSPAFRGHSKENPLLQQNVPPNLRFLRKKFTDRDTIRTTTEVRRRKARDSNIITKAGHVNV